MSFEMDSMTRVPRSPKISEPKWLCPVLEQVRVKSLSGYSKIAVQLSSAPVGRKRAEALIFSGSPNQSRAG